VAQRIGALRPQLALELYECDPIREVLEKLDPHAAGNIDSWIVPQRETQSLLQRAGGTLDRIAALAPRAISAHPSVASEEVWLRFRGLAFAKWDDGGVFFGIDEQPEELSAPSWPACKKLVADLEIRRHPLASDTRHRLYRAQAERWLEAILREDVTRADAQLDAHFVYAQIFANSGGEHGVLDLLGVTRSGRLAILELKATERFIRLPMNCYAPGSGSGSRARRPGGELATRCPRRHAAIKLCSRRSHNFLPVVTHNSFGVPLRRR
jgi:hypothetical protein